jgi:uroporphyrin-III C-methyltransferase/precorrin-2 dehydrogenase/sirohydrochlorin ferrochelatase
VTADGTLPTQRTIVATLDTVAPRVSKDGIRPPAVVVIGEVVNVAAEIAELMQGMPGQPGDQPAPAQPSAHSASGTDPA